MKAFCTPFLLPVVLTSVVSVSHAAPKAVASKTTAPKKTAPAPAAVKPPVLAANSPLVAAQFKRISKAYCGLGSFAVTIVDVDGRGTDALRTQYTAYFGADERLGLKLKQLDRLGVPTGDIQTRLYDGHEAIFSSNGAPAQRRPAKNGTSDYSCIEDFFASAFGAEFIGVMCRYGRDPKSVQLDGKYRLQPLPGGKMRIENDIAVGSGAKSAEVAYMLVGASGLIESITETDKQQGVEVSHKVAVVSRPTSIDANLLTWEKFGPPPSPNFNIDAPSQEAFKRAAKLYGEAKSFSTKILGTVQNPPPQEQVLLWNAEIEWERRGRVYLQSSRDPVTYAYDGSTSYINADGKLHTAKTSAATRDEVTLQMMSTFVFSNPPYLVFNQTLLSLLYGNNELIAWPNGTNCRKVTLDAGQVLDELPCSIVKEIVTVKTNTDPVTLENYYWFAASDGRLLRVTSTKNSESVTDVRLVGQEFDPQLPDSTWKLTEPVKTKPAP